MGEKVVQQQTLLLQTVLLLVASETARFIISCLFSFFFWFLAKSHSKSGMFAVGQDWAQLVPGAVPEAVQTSPGTTSPWPALLLGMWGWESREDPTDDHLKL